MFSGNKPNGKMKYSYFAVPLFFLCSTVFSSSAIADIVYLKNGKVYENATILSSSSMETVFETKDKKRKSVSAAQLLRLRYGQDLVENISILKKDGILINGYLIEQDRQTVLVRRSKEVNQEEIIEKSAIQQMSNAPIVVLYPEMNLRGGIFFPMNPGGANLNYGFAGFLGLYINPPFFPRSKLGLESGFIYLKSKTVKGLTLDLIPVLINLQYLFKLGHGDGLEFDLTPRLGGGVSFAIFTDGEGASYTDVIPTVTGGVGLYAMLVPRKFFVNIFADYILLIDKSNLLHSVMGTLSFQLRF